MTRQVRRTVVKHRYVRAGKGMQRKLWDALRYMEQRPLGVDERPQDRALFTAHQDAIPRREARDLILEHAGGRVVYHRLILSPGAPVKDLQRWTRLVMTDLSRHLGLELHWVAVAHHNTSHPHVHVLLAGTGERTLGDRQRTPVLLHPAEYAVLREAGDRHGRALSQQEQDLAAALRAEMELTLASLLRAIAHELDEGSQSHKHLQEIGERRGAPGRDATRGR